MSDHTLSHPRLRPVEAFPVEQDGEQMALVQDPAGLAEGPIIISPAGLFILSLFDGRRDLAAIQQGFADQFGQPLPLARLEQMIQQLDVARYIDSPRFAAYYAEQVQAFADAPVRRSGDPESFGAGPDGLSRLIDRMLGGATVNPRPTPGPRLVGLIAPHLDYPRGTPCYQRAYETLAEAGPIDRVVILGTNHFGQAASVVATGKDFATPLGTTKTDRVFLDRLQKRCGVDLCRQQYDHQHEHSIELQVLILQHLYGPLNFEIVPVLCPDPCGPTGTAPFDGQGIDLRVFAGALRETLVDDDLRTVVIAGADLSHVGPRFGDQRELADGFLTEVERKDREVIDALAACGCDRFVEMLTARDNDTRICSAGCIFAVAQTLHEARAEVLGYHQAVDADNGTGVTCAAMAFWHDRR